MAFWPLSDLGGRGREGEEIEAWSTRGVGGRRGRGPWPQARAKGGGPLGGEGVPVSLVTNDSVTYRW